MCLVISKAVANSQVHEQLFVDTHYNRFTQPTSPKRLAGYMMFKFYYDTPKYNFVNEQGDIFVKDKVH